MHHAPPVEADVELAQVVGRVARGEVVAGGVELLGDDGQTLECLVGVVEVAVGGAALVDVVGGWVEALAEEERRFRDVRRTIRVPEAGGAGAAEAAELALAALEDVDQRSCTR